MSVRLQLANETDLAAIAAMMNAAFRGTAGDRSWSIEGGYITGNRTDESLLREEIGAGAQFLISRDEGTSALKGFVSLQVLSQERWYLGSLTVDPAVQNEGFGRKLLESAEDYAVARGAHTMEITVVNVRDTLIAWYERRGYRRAGESRAFPYGDNRYGTPTRDDLEFFVFVKDLRQQADRE